MATSTDREANELGIEQLLLILGIGVISLVTLLSGFAPATGAAGDAGSEASASRSHR